MISAVIPVHDNAATLPEQLDAVAASAPITAWEIVVVDNRSRDGSADAARRWSDGSGIEVRVVAADARAGEPHARNVGLAHARGDMIAYCDADDVVGDGWLRAMAAALQTHPYVTGPVLTDRLNPSWLADVRGRSTFDGVSHLHGCIPYAHGCNMGFQRDVLEGLEGFDESFSTACDLEIAVRAWRAGVRLAFDHEAAIHYRLRPSLAATYRQGRSYGRSRHRLRALVPELVDRRAERVANVRRAGWLARHVPGAIAKRATRARWVWVAAQLDGELRGLVRPTR